jgi:multisubunit Na+/H+ antiporter MnhF subunit
MVTKKQTYDFAPIPLPMRFRQLLLLSAVFCFAAPNGYFLYRYMKEPQLMDALLANPLGVCFLSETALLVLLFLLAVWYFKQSGLKVFYYAITAFVGGLAFALPLFLWFNSVDKKGE